MSTPWFEQPKAKALLIEAVLGGVTYERHTKYFPMSKDEWVSAEGPIAEQLHDLATAPFAGDFTREQIFAMGGHINVERAIDMMRDTIEMLQKHMRFELELAA